MIFRSWNFEDLLRIAEMEAECFGSERWTYEMFASSFEQEGFFGVIGEEIDALGDKDGVAYGCVQCVGEQSDLLIVAVLPEYRHNGIGTTLLKRLVSGAKRRGAEKMLLEVRESNTAAQALYRSQGFEEISVRKKYYPDGENALVMVKNL